MVFGTFDLLHPGHIFYIESALKHVEKLIIVVARDQRVEMIKNRKPLHHESARKQTLELRFPEAIVTLGDAEDIFTPIRVYNPDILFFGYDQKAPREMIKKLFPEVHMMHIGAYLPDQYKSSLLRKKLP